MPTAFPDHPGPMAFATEAGRARPGEHVAGVRARVGLGYRYLETDLQAAADGVLVTFDDRTLDR